jgi:hypothetical protein
MAFLSLCQRKIIIVAGGRQLSGRGVALSWRDHARASNPSDGVAAMAQEPLEPARSSNAATDGAGESALCVAGRSRSPDTMQLTAPAAISGEMAIDSAEVFKSIFLSFLAPILYHSLRRFG